MTREEKIAAVREKLKEKLRVQRALSAPTPAPRYDEIFFEGCRWLETLE